MLELIFVLLIGAILLGIATPRLIQTSSRVAVTSAKAQVTSAVALARATAVRYGRLSYLILDVASDRLDVQIDTTILGGQPPVSLYSSDLWGDLGVNLRATDPMICFDPRGLPVSTGACTGSAVVVRLERDPVRDSVLVSSVGRVTS
jgi:type II secretory pathway pseudopilin PulG